MSEPGQRSDWTELDLLTIAVAAERVRDELVDTERQLADLDTTAIAARDLLETRLRALRGLAERYGQP